MEMNKIWKILYSEHIVIPDKLMHAKFLFFSQPLRNELMSQIKFIVFSGLEINKYRRFEL